MTVKQRLVGSSDYGDHRDYSDYRDYLGPSNLPCVLVQLGEVQPAAVLAELGEDVLAVAAQAGLA